METYAQRLQANAKGDRAHWKHGKHPNDCDCTRCTGFLPGNTLSVGVGRNPTHGAFVAPLKLMPEAEAIADIVRPTLPVPGIAFEGTLQSYCIVLARINRAHKALEEEQERREAVQRKVADGSYDYDTDGPIDEVRLAYLGDEVRKWMSTALKHATALGLTPSSAASILRDVKGGDRNPFRPPSQEELGGISLDKLRQLQTDLAKALEPEEYIDAEVG